MGNNQGKNFAYVDKRNGGLVITANYEESKNSVFFTERIMTDLECINGRAKVIHEGEDYGFEINYELYEAGLCNLTGGITVKTAGRVTDPGHKGIDGVLLDNFPEQKALYEKFYAMLKPVRDAQLKAAAEKTAE